MASRSWYPSLVFARPVESCATCALGASGSCLFSPRQVTAGAVLELQGEVATEVSFVKQGLLALSAIDAAGLEMLASVRGPRALIGLEGLHGRSARFTVTALMDSVVCTTAAAALSRDVELHRPSHPASALLGVVLDELDSTCRDANLRAGPARTRVARFIAAYAGLLRPGQRTAFSKRHVATLLGIRPETMSRCLKALADEGLIADDRIEVLDPEGLDDVAHGARS